MTLSALSSKCRAYDREHAEHRTGDVVPEAHHAY